MWPIESNMIKKKNTKMKQQIPKKIPAVYFLLARNLSLVGCSPAEPTSVSVLIAKFITTNYIYNLQNFPATFNYIKRNNRDT
jgi:hypothetical protein